MITIIGLGEKKDEITLLGKKAIDSAKCVVVRTSKQAFGIKYHHSLDDLYLSATDFDDFNRAAAHALINLHNQHGDIVYAVAGDGFCDSSVEYLYTLNMPVAHIAGASQPRPVLGSMTYLSAYDLSLQPQLDNLPLMVHSIDSAPLAGEVKLYLLSFYPHDTPAIFYNEKGGTKITLEELDRQQKYGAFSRVFLATNSCAKVAFYATNPASNTVLDRSISTPKNALKSAPKITLATDSLAEENNQAKTVPQRHSEFDKTVYTFGDLVRLMRLLASPGGCPWDIEQTHESIRNNMLEEAQEAAEAIDNGDIDNLIEELGDVMLQSVFHADIARRHGEFDLSDVITTLCRKLYTRHTHIFGEKTAQSKEDALKNWQEAKARESKLKE